MARLKRKRNYRDIRPDPEIEKTQGERRIIHVGKMVDYSVFRKTPEEKLLLKLAKSKAKEKRRCRPGKAQRARLKLKSNP